MNNLETYYLVTVGPNWALKKGGSDGLILSGSDKEKATKEAVDYVSLHGGSLRIQKRDGTFEEERTYPRSADPSETPG